MFSAGQKTQKPKTKTMAFDCIKIINTWILTALKC